MTKTFFSFLQTFTCCVNVFSSLCAFAIAQNVFCLIPLRRDGSSLSEIACCANP
jgi:hypothetical protein